MYQISYADAQRLACRALVGQGVAPAIADSIAAALVLADADGQSAHGLSRLPFYVAQIHAKKVAATAVPFIRRRTPQSIEVDANGGFAFPALTLAVDELLDSNVRSGGIAMAAIVGSHHCGVVGHPVERLARSELLSIMFANTPKAMHVHGGKRAIFGTNPIAFACPRQGHDPVVLDLSLSAVARGKIIQAARQGEQIPAEWGIDADGKPTSDPNAVLTGSLNAIGGAKGAALALMVEILAGAFVNSQFGFQATSFFDQAGGPPRVGQLLICMNPCQFNTHFYAHLELLIEELLAEPQVRLPGTKRFLKRKIAIESGMQFPEKLIRTLEKLARDESSD